MYWFKLGRRPIATGKSCRLQRRPLNIGGRNSIQTSALRHLSYNHTGVIEFCYFLRDGGSEGTHTAFAALRGGFLVSIISIIRSIFPALNYFYLKSVNLFKKLAIDFNFSREVSLISLTNASSVVILFIIELSFESKLDYTSLHFSFDELEYLLILSIP